LNLTGKGVGIKYATRMKRLFFNRKKWKN